jgi:signal transduction histidine kinase
LGKIVELAVQECEELAIESNVALAVKATSDLPPVLVCEIFFVEALGRLLDNAIKFSGDDGEFVMVDVRTTDGWVEVSVRDQGIGIAAEEIPHLFERFRQIGRDKNEQQGAGLGLAIARELIQLHGGKITVESKPGEGSVFTIRLPVAEES